MAESIGEAVCRLQCETRAIERGVKGRIAIGQRAWCGMHELLPEPEIFEEIAAIRFHEDASRAAMASASATVWRAISSCRSSTIRPSSEIAPLPLFSGLSNAAMIFRAASISSTDGAKT